MTAPKTATAKKATAAKVTPTATKTVTKTCACGCSTDTKSTFAPGHDARFVSQQVQVILTAQSFKVGRKTVKGSEDIQHRIDLLTKQVQANYTEALATKFYNAAMTGWAKLDAREKAASKTTSKAVADPVPASAPASTPDQP